MGQEPHPVEDDDDDEKDEAANASGSQPRRRKGTLHFLSLRDNPRAIAVDAAADVIVIKPVASFFFGNADVLLDTIEKVLARVEIEREAAQAAAAAGTAATETVVKRASSKKKPPGAPWSLLDHLGPGIANTRFILIDAGGSRLLDLWALSCLHRVVEEAAEKGIQVFMSNGGRKLKKHLKTCGLWEQVGGPLVMHSTEDVFQLLSHAPAQVPRLAAEATNFRLPSHIVHVVDEDEDEDEEEVEVNT